MKLADLGLTHPFETRSGRASIDTVVSIDVGAESGKIGSTAGISEPICSEEEVSRQEGGEEMDEEEKRWKSWELRSIIWVRR